MEDRRKPHYCTHNSFTQNLYDSLDDMWFDILRVLTRMSNMSSRNGETQELLGYTSTLVYPERSWLTNERRALSPFVAAAEALWYASGTSNVEAMKVFAPQYINYAEENGEAYGAYGERMNRHCDKISTAVAAIKSRTDTRRAVASLWGGYDLLVGHDLESTTAVRDVPCTLSYQFKVTGDRLNMHTTMRSQDVWLGMPYDIFWATLLQRVVTAELGLSLGTYTHTCYSMHLYSKHVVAANEAIDAYAKHAVYRGTDACPIKGLWHVGDADTLQPWADLQDAGKIFVDQVSKGCKVNTDTFYPIAQELLEIASAYVQDQTSPILPTFIHPVLKRGAEVHLQHKAARKS